MLLNQSSHPKYDNLYMYTVQVTSNIDFLYIYPIPAGDSRNKTRLAKVVVVANSKQEVFSWTQLVVKYTSKNFGYDYTLY